MAPQENHASGFRVSWVLVQELAVGPAPRAECHLDRLEQEGVKAVFSLCGLQEAPLPPGLEQRFVYGRLVLPDHRSGRAPQLVELEQALAVLAELLQRGPVFVHCLAAMERSPLLCMAWLVRSRGLSPQRALDYLQQQHPGTNPLPEQWRVLQQLAAQV
jgi:hypothetical protein